MQSIVSPPTPPDAGLTNIERQQLDARMRRGTHWFYWIAGLSLVNTIISLNGGGISFGIGLAATQVVDSFAHELQGPIAFAVIAIDFMFAGAFVIFGLLGSKGQSWAILTGLVLYALDALLLLGLVATGLSRSVPIIGFIVHGLAIYNLVLGFIACRRLAELRNTPGPPGPPAPPSQEIMSTMGQH